MYKGIIKKSRTYDLSSLVVVLGIVMQNLPMVKDQVGDYYGFILMGLGSAYALLRKDTTGPPGEK